jgi:methionyl-tRNA synthetase
MESIRNSYTAHLANGIGNLTSRIMKMATSYGVVFDMEQSLLTKTGYDSDHGSRIGAQLDNLNASQGLKTITELVGILDNLIQTKEPYKKIKINEAEAKADVHILLENLYTIATYLEIFMPKTSAKILECIRENKMPEKPLFNRLP